MFLDKPLRGAKLLQAIMRTNRPFPEKQKGRGIIVDYWGVFDRLQAAFAGRARPAARTETYGAFASPFRAVAVWRNCDTLQDLLGLAGSATPRASLHRTATFHGETDIEVEPKS